MRHHLVAACVLLAASAARAEVRELEIVSREPYARGASFGDAGPYEVITGVARFAVDPAHARNRAVVDLRLATPLADGLVHFEADFYVLTPKDPSKGNRALLYDVNNRGNKLALGMFGEPFLLGRGFTVVGCGWIGELTPGGGRLLLKVPVATDRGKPIRGVVRYETTTDRPADEAWLSSGRANHGCYPPTERGERDGVLTWRRREGDPRIVIPRGQWSLERLPVPKADGGVAGTLPPLKLKVRGGLRPGYLYELVCEAEGPVVQGLGFAAVRDFVSFLRHGAGPDNPLSGGIDRTHGFGVSQSGRFLRQFVHQGFNADEKGRRVFDGLMPHVAGGGLGSFNHRFAQPTRHCGQHENHLYPADVFPFTYGDTTDPFRRRTDGILRRLRADDPKLLPRVMDTRSAAEYWHRAGSLVHTTPEGDKDVELPGEVRLYAFGGTQHGPAADPPTPGNGDNLPNPGDYRPLLRALLVALDAWVKDGTAPPPSVHPRIDAGTLVRPADAGFPALPGVRYPEVIQRPPALNFGPDFETKGVISVEPPEVKGHYSVLVPKSDSDGNDVGTLLPPEVAVPLAT
ncbi:MAG: alpha/beta hydrolase domain-containing protein, partial [Gemmataceae bacterium]